MSLINEVQKTKMITFFQLTNKTILPVPHDTVEELLSVVVESGITLTSLGTFYTSRAISDSGVMDSILLNLKSKIKFAKFVSYRLKEDKPLLVFHGVNTSLTSSKVKGVTKVFEEEGIFFLRGKSKNINQSAAIALNAVRAFRNFESLLPDERKVQFLNDNEDHLKYVIEDCGLNWGLFTSYTEKFI